MVELNEEAARYFPYNEIRLHQDEFINTIYEAVEEGRSTLVEGSNGLGKTIAALSACLPKALDGQFKILYVARTHRQHDRVIEELRAISKKQNVSGISIRGRHELCLNTMITRHDLDARATMEICEMLKAQGKCRYFQTMDDRAGEYSDIREEIVLHPCAASEIQRICRRKGFCPYELTKSLLPDVNVVALSYLYVFDPAIRSPFLKALETPLIKSILIIDEAHNLPETAVDIASSRLSLFAVNQAENEAKKFGHEDIEGFARIVRDEIEEMVVGVTKEALVEPERLIDPIREKVGVKDVKEMIEHTHDTGILIRRNLLAGGKYPRSFIHRLGYFLLRWLETAKDPSFVNVISRYASREGGLSARLEIVALDPSRITESVFSQVYSTVVMSGTLQPFEAYARITKLPQDTVMKAVPSPFPMEHVLPLISMGVTTAMERRTVEMFGKIVKRIGEVVHYTPANTGIFVPSFEVLGRLLTEGLKNELDKPLYCEHRTMTSKENEKMIADFKAASKIEGAVLLGVQGGRSSEGVDFPGDEMNSVVIVGLPYAEPTPRVRAQISYFEKCFPGYGREYGYILPAMKKASQAAGRPIRTPEDRGAMVFLDHRFATPYCRSFLPSWISDGLRVLPDEDGAIVRELSVFFKKAY